MSVEDQEPPLFRLRHTIRPSLTISRLRPRPVTSRSVSDGEPITRSVHVSPYSMER